MKFLPTRPLELASPSGKVLLAESNNSRGVSMACAATNDQTRPDLMNLALSVEVGNAGNPVAPGVIFNAKDGALGQNPRAVSFGLRHMGKKRGRFGRAAAALHAKTAIDTGLPAPIGYGSNRQRAVQRMAA